MATVVEGLTWISSSTWIQLTNYDFNDNQSKFTRQNIHLDLVFLTLVCVFVFQVPLNVPTDFQMPPRDGFENQTHGYTASVANPMHAGELINQFSRFNAVCWWRPSSIDISTDTGIDYVACCVSLMFLKKWCTSTFRNHICYLYVCTFCQQSVYTIYKIWPCRQRQPGCTMSQARPNKKKSSAAAQTCSQTHNITPMKVSLSDELNVILEMTWTRLTSYPGKNYLWTSSSVISFV